MGLQAEKFRSNLIALINDCELDLTMAYYILKDVLNITEKEYNKLLIKEQQAIVEKIKEQEE